MGFLHPRTLEASLCNAVYSFFFFFVSGLGFEDHGLGLMTQGLGFGEDFKIGALGTPKTCRVCMGVDKGLCTDCFEKVPYSYLFVNCTGGHISYSLHSLKGVI